MTRAIIFVPSENYDEHAARGLEHCERQGYDFQGLILDDWEEANRMMLDGETSVVIVSTEEHLDPQRKPRIEVVANQPASRYETRTRLIRRDGAR